MVVKIPFRRIPYGAIQPKAFVVFSNGLDSSIAIKGYSF